MPRNMSAQIKPQRKLNEIPPLHFADTRARIEFGGVTINVVDGFMRADEAEALRDWLIEATKPPVCARHRWMHVGSCVYRCKSCRVGGKKIEGGEIVADM